MNELNLDQLRAFVDVAELGSFTAAAERRGLSQPAVSLQVRQLEKRLGVTLVERIGRRCQPTRAGMEMLVYARELNGVVAAAVEAMGRHGTEVSGRVRIGTGATACIYLLPPILKNLRRRYPSLEITVSTGNTADFVKAIEENSIDVGLLTLPVSGRMLEVTPVLDDEFVLVAPVTTALPVRIDAEAVKALPLILFEPGGRTRLLADEWLSRSGVSLSPIMSLGSVEAIKELVGAGLGCAILPGMSVAGDGLPSGVVTRSLSPKLKRTLGIVVRRDKKLHRGLAETIASLRSLSTAGPDAAEKAIADH